MSSKVMIERKEFDALALAAKKYVAQEKKKNKLTRLLDVANKTIAKLKAILATLGKELNGYKSIKGQLNAATLRNENATLRAQNATYQATLKQHGLTQAPSRGRSQNRTEDSR